MKKTLRIITAAVLSLAMIITGVPCVAASASINFVSPVITTNPQLAYEICKPTTALNTDEQFSPVFSGKVTAGAPVISSVTATAMPDDSIIIEGSGLENATVYTYGLLADGSSCYRKAYVVKSEETTATAVIDENYKYGIYLVWAENNSGMSYPVRVNAPEIDWTDKTVVSQGGQVSIYGENLSFNNSTEISNVYIENYGYAEVAFVNPYKVTFTVPSDIKNGSYNVYVHNGHGGEYGWSDKLTFTVDSSVSQIWTGDTHTVKSGSTDAVKQAYNEASDYDTVYFPNGTYYLSSAIVVFKKLRFVGESKDGVKIIFTADSQNTRDGFKIYTFPCEFSNITFEDSPSADKSTAFIYAENKYDQKGLTIDNCKFIKCKTYTSKPVNDSTYNENDYADIENFDSSDDVAACLEFSDLKDVSVTNCYFYCPKPFDIYAVNGLIVRNNTAYGTWILDYENGPCFIQVVSGERMDISNNGIYGADILIDPDGELADFDKTFCRSIVVHAHRGPVSGLYMADNDMDRVGSYISNSGEQVLLENNTVTYIGSPVSVSERGLTFADTGWTVESDGSVTGVLVNSDSSKWENHQEIIGAIAVVTHGKGNAQYRRIVAADANSVTLDRPWDIMPDTNSVIMIFNAYTDVVFYRNRVNGPLLYRSQYNATTAIQAWANMVDFRVVDNDISRFDYGIVCTPHYTLNDIASFNVLYDTVISGNKIVDTRYGIGMWLMFDMAADVPDSLGEESYIVKNSVIRRNQIDTTRESLHYNITGGGDGITVGTVANIYVEQTWDDLRVCQGEWIKNTLVENNTFTNMQTSNIRMQYHQGGTILRDNVYDKNVPEISYDSSKNSNIPSVYAPFVYNTPQSNDSMIVEAGEVIEVDTDGYGTFNGGIDKNAMAVTPTATFMNGDFEEGLRYWGYYLKDGDLSSLATIENENGNNYVKVTKPADKEWQGIMSVPFTVEGLKNGDQLIVHFDYKTELEKPQFQAMITSKNPVLEGQTNNGGNICDTSVTTRVGWKGSLIPQVAINGIEEGAAVNFQLDFRFREGTATYSTYFDNIQVFIIRDTTPAGLYETLDGGYVNSRTLEKTKVYTEEDSGYVGNGRNYQTEGFLNSDFSEGLKYWGTNAPFNADKFAMDNAKIVTENGNRFVEITTRTNWHGIESAAFSAQGIKNGDWLAVLVDYKLGAGATGYCADLNLVSGGKMNDSEGRNGTGRVTDKPVNNGWESAISPFVQISEVEDGTLPRFTVTLRNSGTNNAGPIYFDNVYLVIKRADISEVCIQTLEGELLNRESLCPYYGTESDGIYVWDSNNQKNMLSIVTPESADLFNFRDNGLKYWGPIYFGWQGKAGYASDYATVTDGNLVFGGENCMTGYGISSGLARIPAALAEKDWHIKFEYINVSNGHVTFKHNSDANTVTNLYGGIENWTEVDMDISKVENSYISIEVGRDGAGATIRNIAMVYADEGGMDGLFAKVDGSPYGYDKGDATADGDVNIIDLIRMKKYSADGENNVIFLAAASFDGDFDVDGSDLGAFRHYLLGK